MKPGSLQITYYLKPLAIACLAVVLLISKSIQSQDLAIDFGLDQMDNISVIDDNMEKFSIVLNFRGVTSFTVETVAGNFDEIGIPGTFSTGDLGEPKLPALKKLIEIPCGAEASVHIRNYTVSEYKLSDFGIMHPLMPVQPSVRKDLPAGDVPFEFNSTRYETDVFIQPELARLELLGVLRGIRLGRLTIAPVSYNPVKGIIKVYNNVEAEIIFLNVDHALHQSAKATNWSPYFASVQNSVLNRLEHGYPAHPDLTKYPVKYLIVAPRMFEDELQPFIEWKIKKGFHVITGYTDEIGTSYNEIRNWVHAQYNAGTPTDPAPSFLLLVGDVAQIPATTGSSSGKMTDLYYSSVDGDYFPEMYYGRMSATTSAQLQSQINKTLYYEKYEFADPTYLDNITLIAGADGTWNPRVGQPTILYGTNNYFNSAHGYAAVNAYLNSYSGCYDPSRIAVSLINYTAHCSQSSWGNPSLSQSMVNSFVNNGKYPVAIGNCCLSGDFGYNECIGETWQRAANKGSVVYIGSSPSTYWFEDFYWSVGAFPIQGTNNGYVPTYEETTWGAYDAPFVSDYVTAGSVVFVGNLAVTEVDIQGYPSHSSPLYYWQAYNVLGDPSLMPYYTQGSQNIVSHLQTFPAGSSTFSISALPGSYAAVSKDGVLLGAALVDNSGVTEVTINPPITSGTADIVVTKPGHIPYIAQIPVNALQGPFISVSSFTISDPDGNNNGQLDYGESAYLNISLNNMGSSSAEDATGILTSSDAYITIIDSAANFGSIPAGTTILADKAFYFQAAQNIPDQYLALLTLTVISGTDTWESIISVVANAGILDVVGYEIIDSTGNNNGNFDPGETVQLQVIIKNTGHADASGLSGVLSGSDPYITVIDAQADYELLLPGQEAEMSFGVFASQDTPAGHSASFLFEVSADLGLSSQENFPIVIGQIPVLIVDLDGNNNSASVMAEALDQIGIIYELNTVFPTELHLYSSVFVCLGVYSGNHILSDSEGIMLAEYLNTGGRLYMEGGDTWYYDDPTVVHGMFGITGVSDGSGDLGTINGIPGTFAEGLSYTYTGDNGWIDHLTASGSGFLLMQNVSPQYGTAVANDAGTYKTIGASHEFGGLSGDRVALMEAYLDFFGLLPPPLLTQTIQIPAGWSGISSWLIPENADLTILFQDFLSDLIILQTLDGIFYPEFNINTIEQWDSMQGYKIKTSNAIELDISGWEEQDKTLALENGWNLIPVLSNCDQNPEILFNGLSSQGFIIKEIAGTGVYWPAMNINTIGQLQPGNSYFVHLPSPVSVTFTNCK
ncbi:MAG TPA: C25 family cysteine peptidase [Bacteroidales bacterium]|nr:C25 family cysteine peptidase [Bacteroidales bacterium]